MKKSKYEIIYKLNGGSNTSKIIASIMEDIIKLNPHLTLNIIYFQNRNFDTLQSSINNIINGTK